MKYYINLQILLCITFAVNTKIIAQLIPDEPPPEIWSEPKFIDSVPEDYFGSLTPSVTGDGRLFMWNISHYIEKSDTGWSEIKETNFPHVGAERPIISFNGERLYYRLYSNGWDLYYSDWERETGTWSEKINCGLNGNENPVFFRVTGICAGSAWVFVKTLLKYVNFS